MIFRDIGPVFGFIWSKSRAAVLLAGLGPLFRAASTAVSAILSAAIINGLVAGTDRNRLIGTAFAGLGLLFLLTVLGTFVQNRKATKLAALERIFNGEIGKMTMRMDYAALEAPAVGELRARINNDRQWGLGITSVLRQAEGALDGCFGVLTGIALLLPFLSSSSNRSTTIFFCAVILASFAAAAFSVRFIGDRNLKMLDEYSASSTFFGHFIWQSLNVTDTKDIQLFHAYPLIRGHVEQRFDQKNHWTARYTRLHMTGGLVNGLTIGLIQLGANLLILMRAVAESIPVGSVLLYIAAFLGVCVSFPRLFSATASLALAAKRQKSTLEYLRLANDAPANLQPLPPGPEHKIEFCDVSYRYPATGGFALRHVSFSISGHRRIAAVGLNGSGKSTLVKLMCRLIEPTEGCILLDGVDIRAFEIGAYRALFGVIFQDFRLFPFPIGQNVAAGTSADLERVRSSLAHAGFQQRLSELPLGVDTPLYRSLDENGVDVSGGESQKIALARAMYREAPFLLLDEPTAALDPLSECMFYEELPAFSRGKTVLIVTHQISCSNRMDEVFVFRGGALVERGAPAALLARPGSAYVRLFEKDLPCSDAKRQDG